MEGSPERLAWLTRRPSIGAWGAAAVVGVLVAVAVTAGTAVWALHAVDNAAIEAVEESSDEALPLLRVAADVNTTSGLLGAMAHLPDAPEGLTDELAASIVTVDERIEALARADTTEEGAKIDEGAREWEEAKPTLEARAASGEASADDPEVIAAFTHLVPAADAFRAAHDIAMEDVAAELAQVDERRDRATLTMVLVGIAAVLLGALMARGLSRNLVRPIRRLQHAALRVAAGDLEGPLGNGGPRELADLSAAFDRMTADLRRREAELVHHAYHDPLTGLGNRAMLWERLDHALAQLSRREGEHLALFVIDLDNLKKVNDSLGHPGGDEAIVLASQRIAACLREGDTLSRLGGDEFAVIAENIGEGAFELGNRICDSMREPFELGGREIVLSASVGITLAELGTESPVELLRDADLAMYDAKRHGDAVSFFDPNLFEHATARIEQEAALRRALDEDELRVHYQPTIDLRTRRVEGAEALVRWQHPERGLLPPGMFLPLAEEAGLDVPLGWHMLRTALADTRAWLDRNPGLEPFTISVNVSAGQLATRDFVGRVREALAESGLETRHLVLEVTETAILLDHEAVRDKLAAIRDMGVRVALDDFGTGYSSLQHLQHYPVDIVKIDRSFVTDLPRRADLVTLVRAVLELSRAYGLAVVAEGVDAADVAATLTEVGCPMGQGFWFARPAPADVTERFLSPAADDVGAPQGARS